MGFIGSPYRDLPPCESAFSIIVPDDVIAATGGGELPSFEDLADATASCDGPADGTSGAPVCYTVAIALLTPLPSIPANLCPISRLPRKWDVPLLRKSLVSFSLLLQKCSRFSFLRATLLRAGCSQIVTCQLSTHLSAATHGGILTRK